MANAKKCDICSKLYETPICNDVVTVHLDCGPYGDKNVDLCDECYNRLCAMVMPALPKHLSVVRKNRG